MWGAVCGCGCGVCDGSGGLGGSRLVSVVFVRVVVVGGGWCLYLWCFCWSCWLLWAAVCACVCGICVGRGEVVVWCLCGVVIRVVGWCLWLCLWCL